MKHFIFAKKNASDYQLKDREYLCKKEQSSFKVNFSFTFISNIIYAICQWGILTSIVKIGAPEMVGVFALSIAIVQPIFAFTNLQLRGILCSDSKNLYTFGDYLSVRILGILISIMVVSLIAMYNYNSLKSILPIVLMAFAAGAQSLSDIFYGFFQKIGRFDHIAKSMVMKGLISLVVVASIVFLTRNIIGFICGLAISRYVVFFIYDFSYLRTVSNKKQRELNFNYRNIYSIIWLSLPLGVNMMLLSYSVNIPRYYLEEYCGERALGIYSALAYFIVIGAFVTGAVGQVAQPRLAKYYASNNIFLFKKLIFKMLIIALLLGCVTLIVVYVAGQPILTVLYTSEYAKYHSLFLLIVLAGSIMFFVSIFGVVLTSARIFRSQPVMNMMGCLVSFIGSIILIPRFGLMGAGIVAVLISITCAIFFALRIILLLLTSKNREYLIDSKVKSNKQI